MKINVTKVVTVMNLSNVSIYWDEKKNSGNENMNSIALRRLGTSVGAVIATGYCKLITVLSCFACR